MDNEQDHRICPKCREYKPVSDYWKSNTTNFGLQIYCKPCMSIMDKIKRENYKKFGPTIHRTEKKCQRCSVVKPIDQFGTRTSSADGKLSYCKPCWVKISTASNKKSKSKS